MSLKYSNFISTTLTSSLTDSATSFDVASTSDFPALGANDVLYIVLVDVSDPTTREIVKVKAWTGTTLSSVERGVDGTSGTAFDASDLVIGRITKAFLDDLSPKNLFVHDATLADHGDATDPGTLAWVVAEASTTKTTIELTPGEYTVSTNLTIPSTVTLKMHPGAYFDVTTGVTLTTDCTIDAGDQVIFKISMAGTADGDATADTAYARWFGALGNGVANDKGPLEDVNAFVAQSANLSSITFASGDFFIGSPISWGTDIELIFLGKSMIDMDLAKGCTFDNNLIRANKRLIFDDQGGGYLGTIANEESYPEWFGAVADGATDSAAEINKAFVICNNVKLSRGTYLIEEAVIVDDHQILEGSGRQNTVLKLKASTDINVIESEAFNTLTTTNVWLTSGGVNYGFEIRNLQIDGNKTGVSTGGHGMALYGKNFIVDNVLVRDCKKTGIFSEAGDAVGQTDYTDLPEAHFGKIWCRNNTSHGMQYRGPHDGVIEYLSANENGGWGLLTEHLAGTTGVSGYDGKGLKLNYAHTYANGQSNAGVGGISLQAQAQVGTIIVESESPCLLIGNTTLATDGKNSKIDSVFAFTPEDQGSSIVGDAIDIYAESVMIGRCHVIHKSTAAITEACVRIRDTAKFGKIAMLQVDGNASACVGVSFESADATGVDRPNDWDISAGTIQGCSATGGIGLSYGDVANDVGMRRGRIDLGMTNNKTAFVYTDGTGAYSAANNSIRLRIFTNAGQTSISGDTPLASEYESFDITERGVQSKATQNKGTDTITAGTNSKVVTHGLLYTPLIDDIQVTLQTNCVIGGVATVWFVTAPGATTFQLNTSGNVDGNVDVSWQAKIGH